MVDVPVWALMWGMFHGQAGRAHAAADAHVLVDNASAGFLVGVDGMDGAVLGALRIGALLAGRLTVNWQLPKMPSLVSTPDAEVVVVPHAHARDGLLARAPSFFRVHIISQRWQPEQRARSVTIIFVGVVRSSMRPEAMDGGGHAPGGEHAADHQAGNAAAGHGQHGATGNEGAASSRRPGR